MKKSTFFNSLLLVSLWSTFLHSEQRIDPKIIAAIGVAAVIGIGYSIDYALNAYIDSNHQSKMNAARSKLNPADCITAQTIQEEKEYPKALAILNEYKKNIADSWTFNYNNGFTYTWNATFSTFIGKLSASKVFCYNLTLSGKGYLSRSHVDDLKIYGGFMISDSHIAKNVNLDDAAFASFSNCLLGSITQKGPNHAIIELKKSIVNGDITFDQLSHIYLDEVTIINGKITNAILHRANEK